MAATDGKVSFKYIMVGDTEVGKSTLLLMYLEKEFIPSHEMTIGVEFGSKTLRIRNTNVKLEVGQLSSLPPLPSLCHHDHPPLPRRRFGTRRGRRPTSQSHGRITGTPTRACSCTTSRGGSRSTILSRGWRRRGKTRTIRI
mmetsp:Transcript_71228/g.200397  ORF Transcript_71228/g.200397 Transcript_71228/m.200397 type:complete len:141 (+) Transcript_71228:374-796(+)